MRSFKSLCLTASFVTMMFARASGQPQDRQPVDVAKLGPQVGQRVPDFSLKDQAGKTRTLQSIMGPKGAMLIFIRSADW